MSNRFSKIGTEQQITSAGLWASLIYTLLKKYFLNLYNIDSRLLIG